MTDTPEKPTLVITGRADWLQSIQEQLGDTCRVLHLPERGTYIETLINNRAALVLVDGTADDWRDWTSVPKSSPATRRVPIVLISDEATVREAAPESGADLALSQADLLADPVTLLETQARLPDPARQEELFCQCDDPLPERAREGLRMFNAGEYYAQHDLFEEEWMDTEGPVRDLYRAILQVGVAYFQIERDNYRGALKMLQRSVQWLLVLPDRCQGVNVRKLREDSFRVRAELERLGEARFDEFDRTLIKGVEWEPQSND